MRTLIIGIGNPLSGNDATGVKVVRILKDTKILSRTVDINENCASGLDLLAIIEGYDKVIIIDAVKSPGGKTGEIYRFTRGDITTSSPASPHQMDFIGALQLAEKVGLQLPEEIIIWGIKIDDTDNIGENCSPEIEKAVYICAENVLEELNMNPEIIAIPHNSIPIADEKYDIGNFPCGWLKESGYHIDSTVLDIETTGMINRTHFDTSIIDIYWQDLNGVESPSIK